MKNAGLRHRGQRFGVAVAAIALTAGGVAACGSSTSSANKDVIRFAEFPGSIPNWILPITDPGHTGSPNTEQFSYLMWRPLYWEGKGATPPVDESLSLAGAPTYGDGNRTVTVKLGNYHWSDGKPVTTRDVEFWYDLIKNNTDQWSSYVAGNLPDNVAKFTVVNDKTFTLTLKKPTSPQWFTANQLTLITPMPQHMWDKDSDGGTVGDLDRSSAGAKKVFTYLIDKSKKLAAYDKDPLWKTVDGPWKLSNYDTDGHITFVPNTAYTGPTKATVKKFEEVPFATDDAEFNSLLAGSVDYGYLPFSDLKQKSRVSSQGYHFSAWNLWTVNYIAINYNNATTGPLVRQLYLRKALESLVNQQQIIKNIFQGQGAQNYGPIALDPQNPYVTVKANPNPFDPKAGAALLRSHGWTVKPGGVSVCARAGSGPTQCGAGIKAGTKLSFSLLVNSGNHPVNLEMQALKSQFSQSAGVDLQVRPQPFTQVISDAFASCTRSKAASCPWQMADWGGGSNLLPYPTGEQLFASGGASNAGHYADPQADKLIAATQTGGPGALAAYERYVVQQVPEIWVPNLTYQLSMISNKLKGADAQNPYIGITPEDWHWQG